jgi:Uncharacterized conserved protein
MANIGTFTAQNDSFTGAVRTLTLNVKVKFVPNAKESENAPDYRIVAGNFEIGAAWKKISKAERPYLSAPWMTRRSRRPSMPAGRRRGRRAQPDLVAQQGRLIIALGAPPIRRGVFSGKSFLRASVVRAVAFPFDMSAVQT